MGLKARYPFPLFGLEPAGAGETVFAVAFGRAPREPERRIISREVQGEWEGRVLFAALPADGTTWLRRIHRRIPIRFAAGPKAGGPARWHALSAVRVEEVVAAARRGAVGPRLEAVLATLADGEPETTDGASELSDGVPETTDGVPETTDGVPETTDGASETTDGASELSDGEPETTDGASELSDGESETPAPTRERESEPLPEDAATLAEPEPGPVMASDVDPAAEAEPERAPELDWELEAETLRDPDPLPDADTVPAAVAPDPGADALAALRDGRVEEFLALLGQAGDAPGLQNLVAFGLSQDGEADRAAARRAFDGSLRLPFLAPQFILDVLVRPNLDDPPRVVRALSRLREHPGRAEVLPDLSTLAYSTLADHRAEVSLAIHKVLLAEREPDLKDVARAMVAAVRADKLGEADRLAARALPHGHRNPAIFHNAACVYARSGKLQLALHAAISAKEHNYVDLEKMRTDEDLRPLFERSQFRALFEHEPDA